MKSSLRGKAAPKGLRRSKKGITAAVGVVAIASAILVSAGASEAQGGRGQGNRRNSGAHGWDREASGSDRWNWGDDAQRGQSDEDSDTDGEVAPSTTAAPPPTTTPTSTTTGDDPVPTTAPTQPEVTTTTVSTPVTTTPAESGGDDDAAPGDLPGWHKVFVDDFNGASLDTDIWNAYYGQPGGDPGGWWDPSHVVVHDGILDLQTYQDGGRWVSGGVSSYNGSSDQTYGKYMVRFRMDAGYGVWGILLLYGSQSWPPEIDFAENGGETHERDYMASFLHYDEDNKQIGRFVNTDFTQWHTIGVEWTPGKVVYTLDGAAWATLEGDFVPEDPMFLAMQAQTGTCGDQWNPCPDGTTPSQVNLQIDWAAQYSMA